jgi:hypothetical protein
MSIDKRDRQGWVTYDRNAFERSNSFTPDDHRHCGKDR